MLMAVCCILSLQAIAQLNVSTQVTPEYMVNYFMGYWVLATFNDVFAYFVTGPDPAGGLYDKVNIALIPGTTLPVSIGTINNVIPSYPQYYADNTNG
jgi:hypothetical protein